jgi:hypothetical protein
MSRRIPQALYMMMNPIKTLTNGLPVGFGGR